MAENESLDLRISKRWFFVLKAISRDEDPNQISKKIWKALQLAWQNTQKQFVKYGTSLPEVMEAAVNQKELGVLYRLTKRHDYVKLFAAEQYPFDSTGQLVQRVVCASLDRILDQIRDKIVGSELCPSYGQWKHLRDSWLRPIRGEIANFSDRLANRPNVAVRVTNASVPDGPSDPSSFIYQSLLTTNPPSYLGAQR